MNQPRNLIAAALWATPVIAAGALAALGHTALAVLAALPTIVATAVSLHDRWCFSHTSWVVYGLFNQAGDLIYVGMTNDVDRRVGEHCDDPEPWKRQVHAVFVLRSCRSERQAKRIEERRIKALTLAVENNKAVVINNDLHTRPAETASQKLWRRTWMYAYQAEQFMHPAVRWVDNRTCIPIVPPGATDDDWAFVEPDPIDPDDAPPRVRRRPTERATYQRASHSPTGSHHAPVPMLALSPVPMSPCPPQDTPVGGAPGTGDRGQQASGHGGQGTRLADRIREAAHSTDSRAARRTAKKTRKTDTAPTLTADQREAKRRWDETEKKRRQRATARGEAYTKQPWPGDLPS